MSTTVREPVLTTLTGGALAVSIEGVDLTALSHEEIGALLRGPLQDHYTVVLRGQHLSEADHARISEALGPMQPQERKAENGQAWSPVHQITNLGADGKPSTNPYISETFLWHTDMSHKEVPVSFTLLYALELPPVGGQTQYADLYAAFECLPAQEQRRLESLQVVHDRRRNYLMSAAQQATQPDAAFPTVVHPLVHVHPVSGRKSFYLGLTASHVVGMDAAESRALLDQLIEHATQPRFIYSHAWALGDLVIWDNRCLMHRAARDYEMDKYRRIMRRSSVIGTRPVPVQ